MNRLHLLYDSFERFCLKYQISSDATYFSSLVQGIAIKDKRVIIVYYFQIWNKKEHYL